MKQKTSIPWLGLGVVVFGIALLVFAIPMGVSTPSNIKTLVLSPRFWPTVISWILILLGLILTLQQFFSKPNESVQDEGDANDNDIADVQNNSFLNNAYLRLLASAIIMVLLVLAIPRLGMTWATMLAFILYTIIIRSSRPMISLIIAIILPLVLYVFFAHVAGIAIPQGDYLRLP